MKKIISVTMLLSIHFLAACGLQVRDTAPTSTISSATGTNSNFTVGGTATGIPYKKDVILTLNGQEYTVQNGSFTFPGSFKFNSTYDVEIAQLPGGAYTCSLQNDSGTVRGNVNNVNLTCSCANGSLGVGDGSISSPILMYTAQQLNDLGVAGTASKLKKTYRQVCDLDYTGIAPTPIGDSTTPFKGQYDGNGFFILHYHSDETVASKDFRKGVFGYSDKGGIVNVSLSDVLLKADAAMSGGLSYMGGLVGTIKDASTENVYAENILVDDVGIALDGLGGVVGYQIGTTIASCSCCSSTLRRSTAQNIDVYGGASQKVGIYAGWTSGNVNKVEIRDSHLHACLGRCGAVSGFVDNDGSFENLNVQNVTVEGNEKTGGLVGENAGTITRGAFVGTVSGLTTAGNIGGIAGFSDPLYTIKNSYTVSDVLSVAGSTMVGAVYGNASTVSATSFDSTQTCENCTANVGVDALTSTTGIMNGTDDSMTNWDFAYTWCLQTNRYPHLVEVPFSTCQ